MSWDTASFFIGFGSAFALSFIVIIGLGVWIGLRTGIRSFKGEEAKKNLLPNLRRAYYDQKSRGPQE